MSIFQSAALIILGAFYFAYFLKMYLLRLKGIRTHRMNHGKKPPQAKKTERVLSFATIAVVASELASVIFGRRNTSVSAAVLGLSAAAAGVVVFVSAMLAMHDSWRAGIDENEKTVLITNGIYRFSRNPAFLGFDLVYIGIFAAFPTAHLFCFTVLAVLSLHLQILQEEAFLPTVFGTAYNDYKKRTLRYLGKRKS